RSGPYLPRGEGDARGGAGRAAGHRESSPRLGQRRTPV
ncbi:tRNA-dihydrouridine synthase C, partial [Pluralibacter gergoviae]